MSEKLEKLVEMLDELTLLEAAELSKMLQDKWGVSAAAPMAMAGVPMAAAAAEAETAESFDARVEQWDQYSREEFASARRTSSYSGERDDKLEALSNTEGRPVSLQEHLEDQLHLLEDEEVAEFSRVELLGEGGVTFIDSVADATPTGEEALRSTPEAPAGTEATLIATRSG